MEIVVTSLSGNLKQMIVAVMYKMVKVVAFFGSAILFGEIVLS